MKKTLYEKETMMGKDKLSRGALRVMLFSQTKIGPS